MPASRTLLLMRHAAAAHQGGTADHDRPLTAAGRDDAAAAGQWLSQRTPTIDLVVCSTATRTRETLAAMQLPTPDALSVTFSEEIYNGTVDDILGQLVAVPSSANTVLVVGHAPGIPSTAGELALTRSAATGQPEPEGLAHLRIFPAAAIAVLRTDADWSQLSQHGAELRDVRRPGH